MLNTLKDSLASRAARSFIDGRIERYGRLTALHLQSRERSISADILLVGEDREIRIEIGRYRITGTEGRHHLVVEQVRSSRAWLTHVLEDFLLGQPLPIPSVATLALGKPELAEEIPVPPAPAG